MFKKVAYAGIGLLVAGAILAWALEFVARASGRQSIPVPGHDVFRILTDPEPSKYWIVDRAKGLILLCDTQTSV